MTAIKVQATQRLNELEDIKAVKGDDFDAEQQKEIDTLTAYLSDIDGAVAKKATTAKKPAEMEVKEENSGPCAPARGSSAVRESNHEAAFPKPAYIPKQGTEHLVHLLLQRGRRYNPNTGKEESTPFIQMFTYAEWQLFKNGHKRLGVLIKKVLHDPYGEAEVDIMEEK